MLRDRFPTEGPRVERQSALAQGVEAAAAPRLIPLWLKVAYGVWMAVWIPVYWVHSGPENFLWFCDAANFVVGLAIWTESPLLFSSQAAGVLLIQLLWMVDYFTALLFGVHPIGGTEYMFDAATPWWQRAFSLFHVAVPALVVWGLYRLGYDRRGWKLQTAIAWVVLPATFLLSDPASNINWLRQPFGVPQTLMPPAAYLAFSMLAYPLVLFFPSHLALSWWARRSRRMVQPREPGGEA
jgi:hypothetical protein